MTAEPKNGAALASAPSAADQVYEDPPHDSEPGHDSEPTHGGQPARGGERLDALLAFVPEGDPAPARSNQVDTTSRSAQPSAASLTPGVRSAELLELSDRTARIRLRGHTQTLDVAVDPQIDADLLKEALRDRQRVLVEWFDEGEPLVVGILQVHRPREVTIRAEVVDIEASRRLSFRSGRSGLRMESDGDVELVGTRISAVSRGLMRLVGRVLRLN